MTPVAVLQDVSVIRDGRPIVDQVDWTIEADQRWVVLGRNGCGKTTLMQVLSMYLHPSLGTVEVLGERLGRTDVRTLRRRIGMTSAALANQFRTDLTCTEVVMCAKNAALEPWWHRYDDDDRAQARRQLERFGVGRHAEQTIGTVSSGERQRVLLARALMTDPGIVLLDEPTAALDLPGREELIAALSALAADPIAPPQVLVTHHLEEIPPGFTHVVMLRNGAVTAIGPLAETLTSEAVSYCMDLDVLVDVDDGRYRARAAR